MTTAPFAAIGFDAVKQIALARIERRPARLDATFAGSLAKSGSGATRHFAVPLDRPSMRT